MNEIMKIARHRMESDGEGVSTLVAFWGCHLHCQYCINNFCHDDKMICKHISPEELLSEVKIDDIYFKMSSGGVVFGGGEPLLNSDYILDFLLISPREWKYRVETSLNVQSERITQLTPYIDQWIIDVKDINPEIYKQYTGINNELVISNIKLLSSCVEKEKILFRVPYIKDFNTREDIEKSVNYLKEYGMIDQFEYIV